MHTILTIADHPQRTLAPFLERLTTFPTVSYEHGAEIIILIKLLTLRTLCHDLNNSIVFLGYFELLEKQTPLDSLPHALQWKLLRKEGTSLANKTAQIMQSIPERQILIKMLWDRYKDLPEPEKIRLGKLMQEKIGRNEELHEPDLSYLPKNLLLPSIEDCERILHTVETSLIPALQNNCDTAIDLKEFLEGTLPPTPIAENSLSNASHYVETMA